MFIGELILFSISAAPVVLLGRYIYKKDRNKEPAKLLTKLFLGGIISCFLVVMIQLLLGLFVPLLSKDIDTLNWIELVFYVFLCVAFVEELCKWMMSYKIAYNDHDFEESYDMIVYSVFVALGFAFFENLTYVYNHGVITGILRALLAVPGHACDGVFMGYYLGLAKQSSLDHRQDLKTKYLFLSILVPTIIHGIYDYCLFTGKIIFIIIFLICVIMVYIFTIKKVKKMSLTNKKLKYKDNYCPNCGHIVDSNFCPVCGRKHNL